MSGHYGFLGWREGDANVGFPLPVMEDLAGLKAVDCVEVGIGMLCLDVSDHRLHVCCVAALGTCSSDLRLETVDIGDVVGRLGDVRKLGENFKLLADDVDFIQDTPWNRDLLRYPNMIADHRGGEGVLAASADEKLVFEVDGEGEGCKDGDATKVSFNSVWGG